MAQPGSSAVQAQWNLLETALVAKDTIFAILRACADEDVQGQAVLALEGLGFGLMIHEDRREKGKNALKTFKNQVIHQLKLSIGLHRGGLAMEMSRTSNLVAAFLLICACKPWLSDESTGKLLFEMIKCKGVHAQAPLPAWQISSVVSAVSGFSENIQELRPSDVSAEVETRLKRKLTSLSEIDGLYEKIPPKQLATILCKIFEGLQDTEIRRITVKGARNGIWLAMLFLWLCPNETECAVHGSPIFENKAARLSIDLIPGAGWDIQMWRLEIKLPSLIVKTEERLRGPEFPHHDFYPLWEARDVIRESTKMGEQKLEATGQLAAALVDVAVENGCLRSDKSASKEQLLEICSQSFLETYPTAIERYGWVHNTPAAMETFRNVKLRVAQALTEHIQRTASIGINDFPETDDFKTIQSEIYKCDRSYCDAHQGEHMLPSENGEIIADIAQAIHLATEVLLSCFSIGGHSIKAFRPPDLAHMCESFKILRGLLFGPFSGNINVTRGNSKEGQLAMRDGYPYSDFRAEAIKASLPGSQEVSVRDLAIACNGFVAYSVALESVKGTMTDKRQVSSISIVPGSLKLTDEKRNPSGGHFVRLIERSRKDILSSRNLALGAQQIRAFGDGGAYLGMRDFPETTKTEVEHLVDSSDDSKRTLFLTTFLNPTFPEIAGSQLQQSLAYIGSTSEPPVPTSWQESIEAIAFATHVNLLNINWVQETALAKLWRSKGYFDATNMAWCKVGDHAIPSRRYISMTSSNEQLRFFEAGYLSHKRKLFVRHRPTLGQCMKEAFEKMGDDPNWAIIS
jgi:hypothetical protein